VSVLPKESFFSVGPKGLNDPVGPMTKEGGKGDSLTIEMVGLRSARTIPQAFVTCTKRTKTWKRIQKREGKSQPGTRVLDNGKRNDTRYDVQVMDSEERHPAEKTT
jgi:hypothetical protein